MAIKRVSSLAFLLPSAFCLLPSRLCVTMAQYHAHGHSRHAETLEDLDALRREVLSNPLDSEGEVITRDTTTNVLGGEGSARLPHSCPLNILGELASHQQVTNGAVT